jgi:aminopeptidase N
MTFQRLLPQFIPNHYVIHLDIKRHVRTFEGNVIITGEVPHLTDTIVLHAKELTIKKALINKIPAHYSHHTNDELRLSVPQLTSHLIEIMIEFSGTITDTMHGLYPSYYEVEGEKREILSTQCEAHHAREIFPCIDEPEAKASFDISLTTEQAVTVLGNMPIKEQISGDNNLVTTFMTTPIMSTYLFAFTIGDMHCVKTHTKKGVDVAVWAHKGHTLQTLEFALDVAKRSIEFFEDYFNVAYPLPKMDLVAIPDFSSGAMENWGLVTYREMCIIVDPRNAAISQKQQVATVIAHETSHQWFGNLVTMKWWDDLWLNESFANMMEYVAVDALFPQWHIWNEFAAHESLMAKRRDALPGVQPVKIAVHHPDEINTLFDPAIVYAKGGNLLYMLKNYLGEDAFVAGLSAYFTKHAYNNTTGDDLWNAWADASGKNIGAFMKPWLEQSGFPVVSVEKQSISQAHFRIGKGADNRMWPVPLFTNHAPELLEKKSIAVDTNHILNLNDNDKGYFISHYTPVHEQRLLASLDTLSSIERLQILSDANLLVRANQKPTVELFDLLLAFRHETSQSVWDIISLIIADLRRFVENDEDTEKKLKYFVGTLTSPLYKKLGWKTKNNDTEDTVKLRATIISLSLYAESNDAIKNALHVFEQHSDINTIDGEQRSSILSAAVKHSDTPMAIVDKLMNIYRTTPSSDLQSDITAGVTASKDNAIIKKLLPYFTDKEMIKPQDVPRWYAYCIRNRYHRGQTWQWLQTNWKWVKDMYEHDHHYDVFAYYSAGAFASQGELDDFRAFFEPKLSEIALKRTIEVGLDEIASRIQWLGDNREAVLSRLREIE